MNQNHWKIYIEGVFFSYIDGWHTTAMEFAKAIQWKEGSNERMSICLVLKIGNRVAKQRASKQHAPTTKKHRYVNWNKHTSRKPFMFEANRYEMCEHIVAPRTLYIMIKLLGFCVALSWVFVVVAVSVAVSVAVAVVIVVVAVFRCLSLATDDDYMTVLIISKDRDRAKAPDYIHFMHWKVALKTFPKEMMHGIKR